ncbi:MAG: FAD-dependent oxidoreductase [Acidobacteriia bacterium]|nr:FAD-dependent oxidoreductase [Terriglobia bacterium]
MKTVFVVGAGPAGLFAAQKIAQAGHNVIILNRDIKPGGLAEYGIYPVKDKMKFGLRKQFAKIFALPNVYYFGGVQVGTEYPLKLEDLRQFNPSAILFTVGAQGTKKLGLPGENSKGVYSAKDFVYFYNQLPPFASQDFSTGKRIAIVGMGNVMVDIARWVLQDDPNRKTEELIVVARRGPFEAKFDEKEIAHIDMHLDQKEFLDEVERIKEKLIAVGQDPSKVADETFPFLKKPAYTRKPPKLRFRFLCSPKEIHAGPDGRINRLTVTENLLVAKGTGTAAKATERTSDLDVDTMIFAIGDSHDPKVGLPMGPDGFATRPAADPKQPVYQVYDPATNQDLEGVYVGGWARRASEGLVGIARHDGEVAAAEVLKFVESAPERVAAAQPNDIQRYLDRKGLRPVNKADLELLDAAAEREAKARGLGFFKYSDNATMLKVVAEEKAKKGETCAVSAD